MRKRILLVDDDPILRAGMAAILAAHSYQVETSSSGFEALERLPHFQPELVLADTAMPGMDGLEFYRRVSATPEGRKIPFLFLTTPGEVLPALPEVGRLEGVSKPANEDVLLAAVEARLRSAAEPQPIPTVSLATLSPELLSPFFHEFRTSLTMIKTCIALLTNPGVSYDSTELREFLDIVRRGGDRIDRLVRDFLAILKLESGVAQREALQAREVEDVSEPIYNVVQSLHHEIAERNVNVQVSVPEGLPPLPVFEEHLQMIVEKLLQNAVKFSKEDGGAVTVRVSSGPQGIRFEVADQGLGIPPEEQERVFDRFYQLTRAGLERRGAGLGLAVARGLVELYGGTIQVESQLDVGSTFTFVLPIARRVGAPSPGPEAAPAPEAPAPSAGDEDVPRTAGEAFRRLGMTFEKKEDA